MDQTYAIKVIPKARQNAVKPSQDGPLKVYVTAVALDGKANQAAMELLADYWGVKKRQVQIIRGERSRQKIIRVLPD